MAGLKSLMSRRRRVDEEGEDEEGPVMVDDSQSEGSVLSDDGEDASSTGAPTSAVDASATAESVGGESAVGGAKNTNAKKSRKPRKKGKGNKSAKDAADVPEVSQENERAKFEVVGDTEAMMNGLHIDEGKAQPAVDFESMDARESGAAPTVSAPESTPVAAAMPPTNGGLETMGQRQRREHEEYRRKRDADPAFIPNRGNFFMHDTRGQQNGGQQGPPMRGGWQGRGGRGRGGQVVGARAPFFSAGQQAPQAEQAWEHDLHDTINEEPAPVPVHMLKLEHPPADSPQQREAEDSARIFAQPQTALVSQQQPQPARVLSFSSTTLVGKVQIRVFLPTTNTLQTPRTIAEVPWRHYLRLPNHRPPLRRDKPVRVSLPNHPPRYIFPSADRSFIFIPRQSRPNQGYGYQQQGPFHRGSSTYQRSNFGGYAGGPSSRQTSVFGGSVYASSVAGASRRSSMVGGMGARSLSRADAFSPMSFTSGGGMAAGTGMPYPVGPHNRQPVVRLPSRQAITPQPPAMGGGLHTPTGMLTPSGMGMHTPAGLGMQIHTYPLPQQPVLRGTPTHTVHQPRPQKNISVEGIESPALLQQRDPSQDSSVMGAFAGQLPQHLQQTNNFGMQGVAERGQQYGYAMQQGAPPALSGIPEMGSQLGQAFQPAYAPYYNSYGPALPSQQQQQYYYSPPEPHHQLGVYQQPHSMPAYFAPQQQSYMPPPAPYQQMPPSHHQQQHGQSFHEAPLLQQQPTQPTAEEPTQQHGMVARERNGMVFYVPQSEAGQEQPIQETTTQYHLQHEAFVPAEGFVPGYHGQGMPMTPGPEQAYFYPQQGNMWYPGQQ